MELAGLSVAQAIYKTYPPQTHSKVLLLIGPGNNGGDGLVASRHLKLFGYTPVFFYPRKIDKPLFKGLEAQLSNFGIAEITTMTEMVDLIKNDEIDCIVDSLFGFSFRPPLRQPFGDVMGIITDSSIIKKKPIISVDIPSGWDVDLGPTSENSLEPNLLISLTAPKPCSLFFKGDFHYLGGRFITKDFAEKWGIEVPEYPGVDQVVKLEK